MSIEAYSRDFERVMDEVLSIALSERPKVVVDVGVGDSTKALLGRSIELLIVIDVDCAKLRDFAPRLRCGDLSIEFLCGDVSMSPFRSTSIDLAVLHFVLHEVDPARHEAIIRELGRVSRYVLIAEPLPQGSELYNVLASVWRRAMRSVGRFEEYRDPSYWIKVVLRAGLAIVKTKLVRWRAAVPYEVMEVLVHSWIREWESLGVPNKIIEELKSLLGLCKVEELRWSDTFAILATSSLARRLKG